MTDRRLPRVSALILAGGGSRRMGRDKAFIELGGVPLVKRVIDSVAPICTEIILVTNNAAAYTQFGHPIVPDAYPGKGSLGGIFSGLLAAHEQYALAVACDMPFLNPSLLGYLFSLAPSFDVVIPRAEDQSGNAPRPPKGMGDIGDMGSRPARRPRPAGRPIAKETSLHPMHAVYSKNCVEAMRTRLLQNDLRAIGFHDLVRVRIVEPAEVDRFDPQHLSFFNANTPEDLETARALFHKAAKDV
jgi:molybdopterin-guanine dinucleotide biosynthesis protein A